MPLQRCLAFLALEGSFLLVTGFASTPEPQLWPRSAADCFGGQLYMDCPDKSADVMPTCEEPTKHLGGKGTGACFARCECDYKTHDYEPPYKGNPDNRKAIFDVGTGKCIPYEACPVCSIIDKMTDLQTLDPPEWCNKGERKNNKAKCEQAYFTLKLTGFKYRCEYHGDGKCKAATNKFAC